MHSDMSTIPIFSKIQIRLLEQFTVTQITGSAQNVVSQGAVIPSLEMIQNHQKLAQRRVGLWPTGEELQCGRTRPGFSRVCTQPGLLRACQPLAPAARGEAWLRLGLASVLQTVKAEGFSSWLWGQVGSQRHLPGSPGAQGGSPGVPGVLIHKAPPPHILARMG